MSTLSHRNLSATLHSKLLGHSLWHSTWPTYLFLIYLSRAWCPSIQLLAFCLGLLPILSVVLWVPSRLSIGLRVIFPSDHCTIHPHLHHVGVSCHSRSRILIIWRIVNLTIISQGYAAIINSNFSCIWRLLHASTWII